MHYLRYFLRTLFSVFRFSHIVQPGELRTKKHTLTELKKQVELACGGVSKRVQELQTQTGVKDVYTQYWIQQILARAADMRQQDPHASEADIKTELIQWTRDNEEKLYSPFLTLKGTVLCFVKKTACNFKLTHTDRIRPCSRYPRRTSTHNPPWRGQIRLAYIAHTMVR
jgi:hypothetical protein